ncbi:hypothetical protein Pint_05296 [Pistacia integerrima]|uniref:Uncharacterized protein n=1 Tax=Pistacia integerrima TaxID=434235 RepID=A0ACC0Z272_9ROSI|nr:hypothetical protein Pint_05296 [Pistacia integerrima]
MVEGNLFDIAEKILGGLGSLSVQESILAWVLKDEIEKLKELSTLSNLYFLMLRSSIAG